MLRFYSLIILTTTAMALNTEALEIATIKGAVSQSPPAKIFTQTLDLPLDIVCNFEKLQNCNLAKQATLIDFKLQLCQHNNLSHECQNFIKKYPDFQDKIPKCDMKEFCQQRLASSKDFLQGCFYGFWDENIQTAKAIKDAVVKAYETENLTSKAYQFIKQKVEALSIDQLKKNPMEISIHLFSLAEELLNKKGLQMQCLNEKTKAELICRAATVIVDPVLIMKSVKAGDALSKVVAEMMSDKLTKETRSKVLKGHFAQLGKIAEELKSPIKASGTRLLKYKNALGDEFVIYEKTVKDLSGKEVKVAREVSLDPLTNAIDLRSPGGKSYLDDFFADQTKDESVKRGLAFLDIENLNFVNKNFVNKNFVKENDAGDEYLKSVAAVIQKEFAGKGQLVKFGGDEYGVIFEGMSEAQVKEALTNIQKKILLPENRKLFTEEKLLRSARAREELNKMNADNPQLSKAQKLEIQKSVQGNELKEFAKYSQPGVSMGSSFATPGEASRAILDRAEAQAQRMKLQNKSFKNIDSTKYGEGGKPVDPKKRTDFYSRAVVESPASGGVAQSSSVTKLVEPTEPQVVYRLGEMNVEESINALGDKVYYYHEFFSTEAGARAYASREVFVNATSGFFDATHASGKVVMEAALKRGGEQALKSRHVLEVDAKSLGVVNYFQDKTEAGNLLLRETARVIEEVVQTNGIPFKKEGSRFQVVLDNLSEAQTQKIEQELKQKLSDSPAIKALFEKEKKHLETQGQAISEKVKKGAEFSVARTQVRPEDTVESVSAILRKKTENGNH